jgi:hypothetical protein
LQRYAAKERLDVGANEPNRRRWLAEIVRQVREAWWLARKAEALTKRLDDAFYQGVVSALVLPSVI